MNGMDYLKSLIEEKNRDESNLVAICLLNLNGEQIKGDTEHKISIYQVMNKAGLLNRIKNGYLSNQYVTHYI